MTELEQLYIEIAKGGLITVDKDGRINSSNYYRVKIIAQLFGVSVRRIQQLTQEGILPTTETPDGRRYDLVQTVQRYTKYLSDKAYGKAHRTDEEVRLREQKMRADIALKESQGELHRLRTDIASGKYIDIEEVKLDYARFFVTFKKFAMSLPSRVAGMISGCVEPLESRRIEKDLQGEVNRLLESFVVAGVTEMPQPRKRGTAKAPVS